MRYRIAVGAALAAVLLASTAPGATPLKSGPQPGDKLTPFDPLNVNGTDAGEKRCLV